MPKKKNTDGELFGKIWRKLDASTKSFLFFFVVIVQYFQLQRSSQRRFAARWRDLQLCLGDATPSTGFDRHYVFHTAWAARVLAKTRPDVHVDIASSLFFVTGVSAFVPVDFYDYRPAELDIPGVRSLQGDLLALPFADASIDSLSCMHVIEHIGLGRYGEPLDFEGDLKAMAELRRAVATDGTLLFVVPIGGEARIKFNAHRIYTYRQIMELFEGFELRNFSLVPDNPTDGGLIDNASEQQADEQRYGCGCFWFVKKAD